MKTSTQPIRVGTIDDYLNRACEKLQLTETQYATATKRYRAVGEHLTAGDSAIDKLAPMVRPQGSMELGTTTRPVRRDSEVVPFDLDALCICRWDPSKVSSQALYGKIESRLRARTDYADRISAENRCLRLEYKSDDFYLDVVPACSDPSDPSGSRLLIPERTNWQGARSPIETWRSTDPLGYARWFERQCEVGPRGLAGFARAVAPVRPQEPVDQKAPLRRVVQLLKRKRDLDFLGDDCRPSSILLTTLAALHYAGQSGTAESLYAVLKGMASYIEREGITSFKVGHPCEPNEDLARLLTPDARYKFHRMVVSMRSCLQGIMSPVDPPDRSVALRGLVGDRVTAQVSAEVQETVRSANRAGLLGVGLNSQAINLLPDARVISGVQPIRSNNFHNGR